MRSAADKMFSFVRLLSAHPERVRVNQIDGSVIVFEVTACKQDVAHLETKKEAICSVARSAGFKRKPFNVRFEVTTAL